MNFKMDIHNASMDIPSPIDKHVEIHKNTLISMLISIKRMDIHVDNF